MPDVTQYITDDIPIAAEEPTGDFTLSTCECPNCKQVNAVSLLWKHWKPETVLESILQRAINKISTQMS